MAKQVVFVLGATGYIGEAVAQAHRRLGHKVYGLVRSEEGARRLEKQEIIPVLGQQQEPDKWSSIAAESSVVIDAIGYNDLSVKTFEAIEFAAKARLAAVGIKPLYIFTSGIMVYGGAGKNRSTPLDETVEAEPPPGHVVGAARKKYENQVLGSTQYLHPVVVRPGWIYGGQGGHYVNYFFSRFDVATATINIKGRPDKRYSWVSIHDVADAYLKITQKGGQLLHGQLFNIVDRDYPSYDEIIRASALQAGLDFSKVKVVETPFDPNLPSDVLFENSIVIDPKKAEEMLGWKSSHLGFLQEMDTVYKAWKLAQQKGDH